jgi:hypothetical protein
MSLAVKPVLNSIIADTVMYPVESDVVVGVRSSVHSALWDNVRCAAILAVVIVLKSAIKKADL